MHSWIWKRHWAILFYFVVSFLACSYTHLLPTSLVALTAWGIVSLGSAYIASILANTFLYQLVSYIFLKLYLARIPQSVWESPSVERGVEKIASMNVSFCSAVAIIFLTLVAVTIAPYRIYPSVMPIVNTAVDHVVQGAAPSITMLAQAVVQPISIAFIGVVISIMSLLVSIAALIKNKKD